MNGFKNFWAKFIKKYERVTLAIVLIVVAVLSVAAIFKDIKNYFFYFMGVGFIAVCLYSILGYFSLSMYIRSTGVLITKVQRFSRIILLLARILALFVLFKIVIFGRI
jgi:hypothetical protein